MFSKLRKFLALENNCRRKFLLKHFENEEEEEEKDEKKDGKESDDEDFDDFGDLAKETEKEELSTEVPMRDCCDNCTLRLLNSPNKQNCTYIDLEIF